ncbi:hypothetical protein ACSBR1_003561 [Camellia fascicularis]
MTDVRGSSGVCDDKCGCPSPCPGSSSCRCDSSRGTGGGDDTSMEDKRCLRGEHCGCNPCTCPKTVAAAAAGCKCAEGCTCVTCA